MSLIEPPELRAAIEREIELNEADILRLREGRGRFPGATEKVDDQLAACLRWRAKLARALERAL